MIIFNEILKKNHMYILYWEWVLQYKVSFTCNAGISSRIPTPNPHPSAGLALKCLRNSQLYIYIYKGSQFRQALKRTCMVIGVSDFIESILLVADSTDGTKSFFILVISYHRRTNETQPNTCTYYLHNNNVLTPNHTCAKPSAVSP